MARIYNVFCDNHRAVGGSSDIAGVEHIVIEGHHHDFVSVPLLALVADGVLG